MQKFSEAGDQLYAIMNWSARQREEDAALLKVLSAEESRTYRDQKEKGVSDTAIFQMMFPAAEHHPLPEEPRIIAIDIRDLSKRRLVHLLEAQLDMPLPTLERAGRDDLERLVLKLHGHL